MAIVGINQVQQERKPSALEKVAMGLDIVSKLVGIPVSIYEAHTKRKQFGVDTVREQLKQIQEFEKEFVPARPPMEGISGAEEVSPGKFETTIQEPILEERGAETVFNPKTGLTERVVRRSTQKETFDREQKLKNDFISESKQFIEQSSAYGRILASAKDPSAAGDLALIFSYMRLLDPGSSVKETEFANAQNATGVPQKIRNLWNNLQTGQRLGKDQIKDFTKKAEDIYKSSEILHKKREDHFTKIANQTELSASNVVQDLKINKAEFLRALANRPQNTPNNQGPGIIKKLQVPGLQNRVAPKPSQSDLDVF